jgi:hypothetical protein
MIKDCPKRTQSLTQHANPESSTTLRADSTGAGTTERALIVMRTRTAVAATRLRVTEIVEGATVRAAAEAEVTAREAESTAATAVEAAAPREEAVLRADATEVPAPAEADDHNASIFPILHQTNSIHHLDDMIDQLYGC